jgi:hypothetical protein
MYFRFNRDVVLQTNAESRGKTLNSAIQFGRISENEARAIEDRPARTEPEADMLWMPTNMSPVGQPNPGKGSGTGKKGKQALVPAPAEDPGQGAA